MHKAASHLSRALKSVFAAVFALVALTVANAPLAHAAPGVRANVTYQARLMDASGYPVADGVYQVRFSLYDAAVAGTRLWTAAGTLGAPTPVNVSVQDGLFTVLLGDGVTQAAFGDLDWNSDSLYLGVTIGADAEMSPRRPITAVPQAINSSQLGGMSASSSDTYGGQSQFAITQASTTAATSTRSALDVRSNGTSVANDYILRAISSTGVPLFTVNSQGTVSTTDLLVDGIAVCRADGTDCLPVASGTSTLQDVYEEGNSILLNNNALELTVIASGTNLLPFAGIEGYASLVSKGFGEGGLTLVHTSSSLIPTTTYMFFTSDVNDPINATSSYIASQMQTGILQIAAANELGLTAENQGNISLQTIGGNIALTANTTTFQGNIFINGGSIQGNANPFLDSTYSLGNATNRWNGEFAQVTTTYQHLQSALNPGVPYSGAMLINNIAQGVTAGLDIVTVATSTPTQLDNILFLYRADRTIMDQYAELVMGQDSADGYHKLLLEVKEGGSENDLEMTPTSTKLGGDLLPKQDNTYWLGSNNYRWNGYFGTVSTSNIFVGGQSVCLQNGTNCPSAGAISLQNAYDNGRFITQTNGQIAITSVTGTASDFYFPDFYDTTATKVFGAGNQLDNAIGFDLSVLNENQFGGPGSGSLFTFTDNRLDPFSSAKTSFLRHTIGNSNDNILQLGNVTSSVRVTDAVISLNTSGADITVGPTGINLVSVNNSGPAAYIWNDSLTRRDALMLVTNFGGTTTFNSVLVGEDDPDALVNGNIADLYFRYGSTAGSGTQLYTNVDGTNTGWRGLATVDMLPEAVSLQSAYDVGTGIVTQFGPMSLYATTTATDLFPAFPWVDAYRTLKSEGFDNDGISFIHGSGTWDSQHYIDFFSDESLTPGAGTSSYIMGDTLTGVLSLTAFSDILLQAPGDEIILNGATSTFQSNLVMDGTFVGSDFTPLFTDSYTLGTANRRWNRVFANGVSSTVLSLSTGSLGHDYSTGPISSRSVLEISHSTGSLEGFDIANFTLGGTVTGTALFTTANRNAGAPFSATGLSGVTSTGFYGYHSPTEGSDMFVFSQANNKGTFIRMTDEDVSIRAGQGVSTTRGLIDFQGVSTTAAAATFRNATSSPTFQNWDVYARHAAFGELQPGNTYATGTDTYGMYIGFAGSSGVVCLDDITSAETCPAIPSASIVSEGAINAFDFDLAEMYAVSGTVSAGDVVLLAEDGMAVEQSQGVAYDRRAIGVVSTDPGFLLGRVEGGAPIALAGRVPTKVSVGNGVIKAGDRLTTSPLAGVAMKATRAGQTIGIALEDANVSGVIEVFIQPGFDLSSSIGTDGSLVFTNESGSTTFSVDAAGNGYFLGDVSATSFTTHAAFDLAEQYLSADALEPGDIVVASPNGNMMIQRSSNAQTLPMGIISSAPGFVLGAKATGTHPVALAGRVPTKVSTINGEIKSGDLLAPTDIPGVAGKAFEDGPVVGIALEDYNGADIGKIEVFVKSIWYSKPNEVVPQVIENNTYVTNVTASTPDDVRRGLAKIETGAVKVHVTFATLNGYPFIQATPRGLIVGSWSTDNYTDTGFDIILEQPQTFDAVFGWEARALDGSTMMTMSDGTSLLVDPATGQIIYQEPEPPIETPEPAPEPTPESVPEPNPEPVNP